MLSSINGRNPGKIHRIGCHNASDFLGQLSRDWEAAALKAEPKGMRTLIYRFALVLGTDGGLLKQLLLPFRLGLGGPVGDGRQHFFWVHIDDLAKAYTRSRAIRIVRRFPYLCAQSSIQSRIQPDTGLVPASTGSVAGSWVCTETHLWRRRGSNDIRSMRCIGTFA